MAIISILWQVGQVTRNTSNACRLTDRSRNGRAASVARLSSHVRRPMGAYMSQKQQIWWAKLRRQGMLRFVLLYGVLGWGGLTAAIWMAWMWFTATNEYFVRTFFSQPLFFVLVVVFSGLMFGSCCGI